MTSAQNSANDHPRGLAGWGAALLLFAWAWVSCVAFIFGAIEAQWLTSRHTGYLVIGFGILIADCASSTIYWLGWSLRRLFLAGALAVLVALFCVLIAAFADV